MDHLTVSALTSLEPAETDAADCGAWLVAGPIGVAT
jgi:hypothetical protein